jgi:hypothetical protein
MFQEILTYMIIGSAITLAVIKMAKKLLPKPKKVSTTANGPIASIHQHNCSECSADCQLRDLPKYVIQKNTDACLQIERKSKSLKA